MHDNKNVKGETEIFCLHDADRKKAEEEQNFGMHLTENDLKYMVDNFFKNIEYIHEISYTKIFFSFTFLVFQFI